MSSLKIAGAIALLSVALSAQAEDAAVAVFKNVTGEVKVLRAGVAQSAAPGMSLLSADTIVSANGASGGIAFKDGTLVTVGAHSRLEVRDYVFEPDQSHFAFDIYLAKGSAVYSSGTIGKMSPQSVHVSTPSATVGVRGTRFIIQAD